jgi:hypothetical protein
MFWGQVSTPLEATNFLIEMLSKLSSTLEKNDITLDSLLNTINFIILLLDIQINDSRIKRFLDNWYKQESIKNLTNNIHAAKDVIRMLHLKMEENDMIGPLIIGKYK